MPTESLLSETHASRVLDHALFLGADFAELFVERQQRSMISTLSDEVKSVQSGIDFGIGVRLVYGDSVLYGYTNRADIDSLYRLAGELAVQSKRGRIHVLPPLNAVQSELRHPVQWPLSRDPAVDQKVSWLMAADKAARADRQVQRTQGQCMQREQQVAIFNTDGLVAEDTRHYTRASMTAIAGNGTEQATGSSNDGGLLGWELSERANAAEVGSEAARQASVNLSARACPSGRMPVVIGNGFGGVIFHEACGHLLETTAVAKQASVFHDKMGEMIASPVVSAVDDGTLANAWGSIHIDDEGMPTQRTQLIQDGRLTGFLADRQGSLQTGHARTGSGRRESYRYAPASRMRNTFIEPGDSELEDMIGSMDRGIYAAQMGGGSVQPGTGEFNFAVTEGYYVENGRIQYPVKAATLISTGPAVLREISMVGKDFALACGMCGSVSGAIPTTVGQPALKVDDILVGGNA